MRLFSILMILGVVLPAWAFEERHADSGKPHSEEVESHEEEGDASISSDVGPERAVTAADPKRGIQLAEKAIQALQLKTRLISGDTFDLPREAIVASREETGVYRLRDGWFRLIHGDISGTGITVRFQPEHAADLRAGDAVVIEGAGLLRVADVAAFEGGGGHHH